MANTLLEILLIMTGIVLLPFVIIATLTILSWIFKALAMALGVVVRVSTEDSLDEEDKE